MARGCPTLARMLFAFVAGALVLFSGGAPSAAVAADAPPGEGTATAPATRGRYAPKGWTVHIDNDLFAFTDDDRDYTAGGAVTLGGGDRAGPAPLSAALDWLDARSGFGAGQALAAQDDVHDESRGYARGVRRHRAFTVGVQMFTPRDLARATPIRDDRPYANLAYVSMAKLEHDPLSNTAFKSSLTLGVLGLPVVGRLHRTVHGALGGDRPMGYAIRLPTAASLRRATP